MKQVEDTTVGFRLFLYVVSNSIKLILEIQWISKLLPLSAIAILNKRFILSELSHKVSASTQQRDTSKQNKMQGL